MHVPAHDRHILEMTLASFAAYRTIVGVVGHEPFDIPGAKLLGLGILDGDAGPVFHLRSCRP